ncbi:hypothetical protein LCGC14_1719770 [marine sediment metagenome]|uniref:Uncharacterized protein n=2 Tax=root TaxID=1 RepID=A0A9C9NDP7_9HYPH|nr:hypothetical protein [Aurantimonas coralicida]
MITVYENKEAGGARVKIHERIYQTTDGELVGAGHADAATLYASAGKEVPRAEFEALGGVVKSAAQPKAAPKPAPVTKPKPKAKPKAAAKPKAKRKTTKKGK